MSELKPCPFCGGEAKLDRNGFPECTRCKAACASWNERTEDKRIEELEAHSEDGWDKYRELRREVAQDRHPSLTDDVVLKKIRGLPDRWRKTSRRKTQNYTDLCGAADELDAALRNNNEILDIPYDRIDGGVLDLYGEGKPKTLAELMDKCVPITEYRAVMKRAKTAECILKEINKLHVYKPDEIAERVNEGWVSMPDFVSVNEIRAISKIIALEVDHD
ncbi:MAG: Lar family restriction alleviation protein [Gammaproteobacteria bacterium]|nr:Lar family restriction alleviation protein [Gammaproteobacteria bacterium]